MIYGILMPKEKGRLIKPLAGHEKIVLAVKGDFQVTGCYSEILKEGSAFHNKDEQECFLKNQVRLRPCT